MPDSILPDKERKLSEKPDISFKTDKAPSRRESNQDTRPKPNPAQTDPVHQASVSKAASSAAVKPKPNSKPKPKKFSAENAKKNAGKSLTGAPAKSKPKAKKKKSAAKAENSSATPKKALGKKQAKQIAGLIMILILVVVLGVLMIFNHYFGLFRPADEVNNSEAMSYDDIDLNKADTFDKVTEDEKLKELTEKSEKITSRDVMNILLIGEDLRDTADESAGTNTDVMMIISVNKKDNTITMTSIMRDIYVAFGDEEFGYYSTRINAAYWHGGVELLQKTIEDYMSIQIDRYVLVNFKVFIDIVDTLGGLDLYVSDLEANGDPNEDPNGDNTRGMQNPLDEQNKYLGNKKGTDYIEKGGDLHLNGNQALAYARLRHVGNADYERTARQRKVIQEMIKKSKKLSLVQMDELANKIFPQVRTDVTRGELAGLLVEMLNYRNYKTQEFRVPADDTFYDAVISGMDVLQVDWDANRELFLKKVYGTVDIKKNTEKPTIE